MLHRTSPAAGSLNSQTIRMRRIRLARTRRLGGMVSLIGRTSAIDTGPAMTNTSPTFYRPDRTTDGVGVFGSVTSDRPAGLAIEPMGSGFAIHVLDAEGASVVTLGSFHEDEVIAAWRRLSVQSGLPLLVPGPTGTFEPLGRQIGRLAVGTPTGVIRHAVLASRRPRFLVRRKPGRFDGRPIVYREKEMARGRAR